METDAELKIFSAIGAELHLLTVGSRSGTLFLYSERNLCGSCSYVKQQFEDLFLDINVKVRYTDLYN